MRAPEDFFDAIDGARVRRARELSEIKRIFIANAIEDPLAISSKSIVVLAYAAWEGFYNESMKILIDFLQFKNVRVADASWNLLLGAMSANFNSLRDRHHSDVAKREFIEQMKDKMECDFTNFDRSVVMARSNLDFNKLKSNLKVLDIDLSPFQASRLRIDKELVGWRHSVAHGDPPDLSAMDMNAHIDFAAELLLTVSDSIQNTMLGFI